MKIIEKGKVDCSWLDDNEITNDFNNTSKDLTVNKFNQIYHQVFIKEIINLIISELCWF